MHYNSLIIIVASLISLKPCFAQHESIAFKKVISENKKGKTFVDVTKKDTAWRTFLGFLTIGPQRFATISEFKKVKAASTWRGHSNVFLIDKKGTIAYRIIIGMPDELPVGLKSNSFIFKNDSIQISAPYKLVGNNLYCVTDSRCYEVVREW